MSEQMMIVSEHPDLIRVRAVQPLDGFIAHVVFTNGQERDIDFSPYLEGPIFEPIRQNPELFRQVFVDHGAPAWQNGADIDPDTLYYDDAPPWANESCQQSNGAKVFA